jgi:EAL and modified HD-GYP domain-containing signal transduction protein
MITQAASLKPSEAGEQELSGALRYVARQPILDLRGRVHGYELLFRDRPEELFRASQDQATRTMLDNTVIFGLEKLTGGQPAFLRCTAESLTERLVDVLPASMTVLEVREAAEPTQNLIVTCQMLKSLGFRLALGSYCWEQGFEPLVELADYIKVDFTLLSGAGRQYLRRRANQVAAALIAEKVETQQQYNDACTEGFRLFQGFYFCHPEVFQNRKVPSNRLSYIKILELLNSDPLDMHLVGQSVKRDASLTYRLLRLVNSPMCAMRHEVRSIESALMVVGEETFRRIATLAITSELNTDRPPEILRMAFARGRFCEQLATKYALDPAEQYLLGMFSLLPAMLRLPMEELTPVLPLRTEIQQALHGAANLERSLLSWLEAHENGDWSTCDTIAQTLGLNRAWAMLTYVEALVWAAEALYAVN